MQADTILFDLDGTLTNPKEGITKSMQYALRAFGIHVDNPNDLAVYIGPPLREPFLKHYGFSEEDTERAVGFYREYYAEKGMFENEIYEGVVPLLKALRKQGKTLAVATSKATPFALPILRHFGIEEYFDFVAGAELDGSRSDKALVIRYALEHLPGAKPHSTVMVGDRKHDIQGARACGLAGVGVLYGYGDYDELREAGASAIAADVPELGRILLGT